MSRRRGVAALAFALAAALPLALAGCRQGMFDQAKYEPYEKSPLFDDESSARPLPEGTVAWGALGEDRAFHTGMSAGGAFVAESPVPWTREVLARGRRQFDVFCAPCHSRTGDGDGMIVRRGYKRPASYHEERLRGMPDGYFFDVITRGYGVMPSYAQQVPVADRWAIVGYVRALQRSRTVALAELPAGERAAAGEALAEADRRPPAAQVTRPGEGDVGAPERDEPLPDSLRHDPAAPMTGDYGPPAEGADVEGMEVP